MRKRIVFAGAGLLAGVILAGAFFCLYHLKHRSMIIVTRGAGGRMGDKIIEYAKTKWLAHKYKIPFYMIPFEGSEKFMLSRYDKNYKDFSFLFDRLFYRLFGVLIYIDSEDQIVQALKTVKKPIRFVINTETRLLEHLKYPETKKESAWVCSVLYEKMLEDHNFANELKKALEPVDPSLLNYNCVPKNKITVAVHIRKGTGFDPELGSMQCYDSSKWDVKYKYFKFAPEISEHIPMIDRKKQCPWSYADGKWPDKFPPEQYYVDQIKKLSSILHDTSFYVHVFTDDKDKQALVSRIKESVAKSNIEFAYSGDNMRALHDLYAMTKCDCLIRSGSGFGYLAQLLGEHKIIMYPIHLTWHDRKYLVVDNVGVILRKNLK